MSEEKVGYYSVMDAAMDKLRPNVCEWKWHRHTGRNTTTCGIETYYRIGNWKYCPFCGKPISEVEA